MGNISVFFAKFGELIVKTEMIALITIIYSIGSSMACDF